MPVRPVPGVEATVESTGNLELFLEPTEMRLRYGPIGALMWIALRQHDGHLNATADMLATFWSVDPANMRADLDLWVDELSDAGLLRHEAEFVPPAPSE